MGLKLITAPPVEPLTRADAYVQCQIDLVTSGSPPVTSSVFDDWIDATLPVVRAEAENTTARALVQQTWELWLDHFPHQQYQGYEVSRDLLCSPYRPRRQAIRIPLPPLQSVLSVKYIDTDGVEQTLDPTAYVLDNAQEPAQVVPVYGTYWPRVQPGPGSVKIRFVCGYAPTLTGSPPTVDSYTANIPRDLMHWMKLHLAHWFRNREGSWQVTSTSVVAEIPFVDNLISGLIVYGPVDQ